MNRITRRDLLAGLGLIGASRLCPSLAAENVDLSPQAYFAIVTRVIDALATMGAPVTSDDARQLTILSKQNDFAAINAAERILDRYTLARITLGDPQIAAGGAERRLIEQGWRTFLVRVANAAGWTDYLSLYTRTRVGVPGKMLPSPVFSGEQSLAQRAWLMDTLNKAPLIAEMWLLARLHEEVPILGSQPHLGVPLSGHPIEYRIAQLFSRDQGRRTAKFAFVSLPVSGGAPSGVCSGEIDFECEPSRVVTLSVLDVDGRGCMASLTIQDKFDQLYPPLVMRIAPDMPFQKQIYRADGETVLLPDGEYTVESKRGPEYLRGVQTVSIDAARRRIDVKLQRWIDPAHWGWYSGDTHIHAAGCKHYDIPTEGVSPETMIRHVRGEALSIGNVLSWAPSWYYQKQFFSGHADSPTAGLEHPELQAANNANWQPRPTTKDTESTLRYDVEVSGFPSGHSGHLVLLRLKEQDYPGTRVIEDWPSWNLPILKWARAQGALGGYAHCGAGLSVDSTELPNYEIPPFDSIGANEAIVDVTHGYTDFLSGCNGPPVAELNVWYHLLNCGFRLPMVGETDYPCVAPANDTRPGIGRSYVRLDQPPVGDTGYEAWVSNLRRGRLYHGDGRSHFLEFMVNGRTSGHEDVSLRGSAKVTVTALVAAWLDPVSPPAPREPVISPLWNIEHARIEGTREVLVECVVNGIAVARISLLADGKPRRIRFTSAVKRSSWVALRIMNSGHTYPVFVRIDDQPLRASTRSARWCRTCVDKLWKVKAPFMRESERLAAAEAFEHARTVYDTIAGECDSD